jgi:hypothetical protein
MVNWVLVFFMAGQPQDYNIHTAYNKQINCVEAQERYSGIFLQTGSKMLAECRPRNQVQTSRQSSVVYKKYRLEN